MLEEQARRAPELGLAAVPLAADLSDEALLLERAYDAVGVDAADGADPLAGDGLAGQVGWCDLRLRGLIRVVAKNTQVGPLF